MKTSLMKALQSKSGAALLTVMGIILLISGVVAGMVAMGHQQVFSAVRLRDLVKAQMIAEAGINDAYNVMKTNFAARLNPANFPAKAFDGGTYDALVIPVGSNSASIVSTGFYGTATATVRADIKNFPIATTNGAPVPGGGTPYGFTILSGGDLNWAGNSDVIMTNGNLHSNGSYLANGVNTIHGNVESCIGISLVGGAVITGTGKAPVISGGTIGTRVTNAVPIVSVPNIDLTPYYNAALANGQVFSGTKTISGTVSPPGGIMWVNGTLSLGNGTFNGCFIATGAIDMQTSGNDTITLNKVNRYPLLASRDGSITVKQVKLLTFSGLIYAKTGSFDKQGNGDVIAKGAIIAAGNVTKNGGWSAFIYDDPTPVPPGGSYENTQDKVVITAWQD